MQPKDRQIVNKLIAETNELAQLLEGYDLASFLTDERTKRAVSMTLINIGELVKNLTEEMRSENSHIRWKLIAGLRDVTAHRYQTLNMEDIWETAHNDIPVLHKELSNLL